MEVGGDLFEYYKFDIRILGFYGKILWILIIGILFWLNLKCYKCIYGNLIFLLVEINKMLLIKFSYIFFFDIWDDGDFENLVDCVKVMR